MVEVKETDISKLESIVYNLRQLLEWDGTFEWKEKTSVRCQMVIEEYEDKIGSRKRKVENAIADLLLQIHRFGGMISFQELVRYKYNFTQDELEAKIKEWQQDEEKRKRLNWDLRKAIEEYEIEHPND